MNEIKESVSLLPMLVQWDVKYAFLMHVATQESRRKSLLGTKVIWKQYQYSK